MRKIIFVCVIYCVISIKIRVIKRKNNYYPNFRLQNCFYESESL